VKKRVDAGSVPTRQHNMWFNRWYPVQSKEHSMKALNIATLVLVIVGGVNWGLVGLFDFDLVAAILGSGSLLSRIVYILVGLSALWQVVPLAGAFGYGEALVQPGGASH
jgi:uncharacterized membrane protein YuzA (DUF378 family)